MMKRRYHGGNQEPGGSVPDQRSTSKSRVEPKILQPPDGVMPTSRKWTNRANLVEQPQEEESVDLKAAVVRLELKAETRASYVSEKLGIPQDELPIKLPIIEPNQIDYVIKEVTLGQMQLSHHLADTILNSNLDWLDQRQKAILLEMAHTVLEDEPRAQIGIRRNLIGTYTKILEMIGLTKDQMNWITKRMDELKQMDTPTRSPVD
jgi:hypothetical protein